MRISRTMICLSALLAAALSPSAPQKGIEPTDIDRHVDPCADFYDFANGAWRAGNPIPASMPRWSRRWAAGEASKDRLKLILEEASAGKDQPKGSVEQLIGDFYGACMDETRANSLGVKPLAPLLAEIAGIKNTADVRVVIARLHGIAVNVPFVLFGGSDNHNPTDVIAQIVASGLGMPDRDYYLKPEPRFKEAREKYLAHVAAMFRLAGESDAVAKSAADTVMRMETQLAENSLDNVALRDPKATDHKTSFGDLQKMTPDFNWTAYYHRTGLTRDSRASEEPARIGDVNVAEPKFLAEFNRQLTAYPVADWKTYLEWHLLNSAAGSLSDAFVREDFAFNGAFLSGAREMKPRWKRCAESADRLLGEALGKKYVEKYFPPEAKARMQELVKNLRTAMGETIQALAWMTPETKKRALEKLSTFNPKIGYPDRWKDYSKVAISRASYWDDVVAGRQFNVRDNLATIGKPVDRGRWGMTPPTSDA